MWHSVQHMEELGSCSSAWPWPSAIPAVWEQMGRRRLWGQEEWLGRLHVGQR